MRSDLVFSATGRIENRFRLCHLVRISSRKFHRNGVPFQKTINKVLGLVTESITLGTDSTTQAAWESSFGSRMIEVDRLSLGKPAPVRKYIWEKTG